MRYDGKTRENIKITNIGIIYEVLADKKNNYVRVVTPSLTGDYYCTWDYDAIRDRDIIVMQLTNLPDKNGKEVSWGDVVQGISKFIVTWDDKHAGFMLQRDDGDIFPINKHSFENKEVIGNIHENLELRKEIIGK